MNAATALASVVTLVSLAWFAAPGLAQPHAAGTGGGEPPRPTLDPGLGPTRFEISTRVADAQRFFDQGYRLLHAFNPEEAERSFREVARLDGDLRQGLLNSALIAVGVTVFSQWVTLDPHGALFGAFFVAGAIFSGIGALIVLMAVLRRTLGLQRWLTPRHFLYLGYLLAALGLVMVYLNVLEFVTVGYKLHGNEAVWLAEMFTGAMAPLYWTYAASLAVPGLVVLIPALRRVGVIVAAALLVVAAMWTERWVIVVGSLRVPQAPYPDLATYAPTWVELSITAGLFALFALLITLAVRFVPVISMWEVREHEEVAT